MRYRCEYDPAEMHLKHPEAIPEYLRTCPVCAGVGEHTQTFTYGCGAGYYRALGVCEYCRGIGLTYKGTWGQPAPPSVLEQIKETVRRIGEAA